MDIKIIDFVVSENFEKTLLNKEKVKKRAPKKGIDIEIIREAEGVLTNYVVKKFFNHEETMYSFLSLICNTFQNMIDTYSKKRKIRAGDILFIYKGGNILRIVSKEFWLDLPSYASKDLIDFYEPYFSRSDADFSIYINPSVKNFDLIFKEISFISYLTLNMIRKEFLSNTQGYFDIYRYNKKYIAKTLRKLLSKVNKIDGLKYDHIALENMREDEEDFEVRRSYDKFVMGGLTDNLESVYILENNSSFVNKIRDYLDINLNGNHAIFSLIRTKVKFNVWTGNTVNKLWGELIDVTVIHKDYRGVNNFFSNLNRYITRYSLVYSSNKKLDFYSYSLNYLIRDLENILLYNEKYIWMNTKYKKRVRRLMYLYFMEIFISEKDGNRRLDIYKNLKKYFEGKKNASSFAEEKHAIYNIIDYIERINIDLSDNERNQLESFKNEVMLNINFIISVLENIKDYCSIDGKVKLGLLYETKDSILK